MIHLKLINSAQSEIQQNKIFLGPEQIETGEQKHLKKIYKKILEDPT